jgi:STE24 endopeptidase
VPKEQHEHDKGAAAPMPESATSESKAYGRRKVYCHLANMALELTFLVLAVVLAAKPLDDWLLTIDVLQATWARLVVFFLVIGIAEYMLSFPLTVYSGFALEHQYGLSRQSFARWFRRDLLKNLLMLALGLVMIQGLFWLIRLTGSAWWLAAAGLSFVVSVLLGQLVPVLILPLFYKIEPLENQDLADRFRHLTEGTTLSIRGIYRMQLSAETVKANAMLAGLGRTRRVILGDTLLDGFTPDEIEVVLAHEIGHHVHHHIPKLIAGGLVLSGLGFFVCDLVLQHWLAAVRLTYAQLPVYALPLLMLVVTLFSLLAGPIQNAVSRHFERQSDRFALRRTEKVQAYLSAFGKLARLNKSDPRPPALEVFLFHDHPPIAERLAMGTAMAPAMEEH